MGDALARDFRAADAQIESYPTVQALAFMDRLIAERTGGRHRIRIFHSRQLGEEKESIEQTRVGAIVIVAEFDRTPFQEAISGVYDKALRDQPSLRELVKRIGRAQ